MHIEINIYIYIYVERERERERDTYIISVVRFFDLLSSGRNRPAARGSESESRQSVEREIGGLRYIVIDVYYINILLFVIEIKYTNAVIRILQDNER